MQEDYRSAGFVRLCFEKLLPLVVLNLLFLLTCLPVLTAGAGWTALCSACQGLLLDEKQPYRRFWSAFRINFLPSLPLGVIFFAGPAAVLYGCWFYFRLSEGTGFAVAISCFCLICGYLLWCAGSFAFSMLARVKLKFSALLKNAFALTFRFPRPALGWLLLSFALTAAVVLLLPYSFPWLALLGAALPCFTASRGVLPVIDDLIVKE